jgi:hypothetical protein
MRTNIFQHILMVGLLCSCAATKPNVDYDTEANFSSYKTYALSEVSDEKTAKSRIDSPLVHQRVRESIESQLDAKGLKKVDRAQADILIAYHLSTAAVGHTGATMSLGVGRSTGRSSLGVSVGVPLGQRVVEEGTLVIDIIDSKTNTMVWRGVASRRLSQGQVSAEQAKTTIDGTVEEILMNYPPKQK